LVEDYRKDGPVSVAKFELSEGIEPGSAKQGHCARQAMSSINCWAGLADQGHAMALEKLPSLPSLQIY
jgi:hypothetical protein